MESLEPKMLKVSLVRRKSDGRNSRISIPIGEFTIGRHVDCSMTIRSKLISRRHCAIHCDENSVSIRDLGSRNGVILDGNRIPPDETRSLSHHTVVQIGSVKFRLSIRDLETGRPWYDEGDTESGHESSDAADSVAELEQILEELDDLDTEFGSDANMTTLLEVPARTDTSTTQSKKEAAVAADANSAVAKRSTIKSAPRPASIEKGSAKIEDVEPTDDEHGEGHGNRQAKSDKQEPSRLPEHLRPKLPVDSKEAAQDALKRFFTKN